MFLKYIIYYIKIYIMDTEQVQNLDTNNITSEIKNQENQQKQQYIRLWMSSFCY